jgi:hypothetical protein
VTEPKENLVSIKVASSLLKELKKAQRDYVDRDEKEPTYSALLTAAWKGTRVPQSEPNGHPPHEDVTSGTIPEFGGLSSEDMQSVREFIEILRGGGTWKQLMANMIEGWKEIKRPAGVRAVADPVEPGTAKASAAKSRGKAR